MPQRADNRMELDVFLIPPAESARRKGPHDRIVMSSRVRLARNLKQAAFPGWAKKVERIRLLELLRPAIEALPEMKGAFSGTMDSLSSLTSKSSLSATSSAESTLPRALGADWC